MYCISLFFSDDLIVCVNASRGVFSLISADFIDKCLDQRSWRYWSRHEKMRSKRGPASITSLHTHFCLWASLIMKAFMWCGNCDLRCVQFEGFTSGLFEKMISGKDGPLSKHVMQCHLVRGIPRLRGLFSDCMRSLAPLFRISHSQLSVICGNLCRVVKWW